MKTYPISEARKSWGKLLREAQGDKEVPFTLRLRQDPACVGAPRDWFKRACHGLEPAPEVRKGFPTYNEQRLKLHLMVIPVLEEGAFVSVSRVWGTACVLVPIPWYEERKKAIGPPAGEDDQASQT
ncbi:type II toxin-antitoxin system Phd/YefM family antitoxin [Streptomyces solisilvae]|uniref:type II toxin-antitoxin system Phd/YefM family antitoxin n=1 Tax=Streptomyces malaysiensis TaxID=92644 RepID=UPI0036CB7D3A